jgi:hypothetical protein
MPKSRQRKKHKERVQARKNQKANQMAHIKNLTNQFKTALASANPESPVQPMSRFRTELTGQNNEQNYEQI